VVDIWTQLNGTAIPFVNSKGDLILLFDKFVYGLKQSPFEFQQHLRSVLRLLGYVKSEYDDCLHVKIFDGKFSIISTHVDDILQVTNATELVEHLHQSLNDTYGEVQFNQQANAYLGMNIHRSLDGKTIQVDHAGSISKLVDEVLTEKDQACRTPHVEDMFDNNDDEESNPN